MSQRDEILSYLQQGQSLTPLEALSMFGCFRLAARIRELRADGYNIRTDDIKVGNKSVAQYRLHTSIPRGGE